LNLYFLVEGLTERKVYPQWLIYLLPSGFSRVNNASQAVNNNYFLISGGGYPSILDNHLRNSVDEVNEYDNYDWLILVIDADDMSAQDKIAEVEQFIKTENIVLNSSCHLQIVTQKCCMETWFLGNNKAFPRNSDNADFINHSQFYDISQQDPELMTKPNWFNNGSISIYHETYLRKMLAEKNIRYSKANPNEVGEKHYLEQLQKRVKETNHLPSLKNFLSFCATISAHNPS
jgi:hypothetical protein